MPRKMDASKPSASAGAIHVQVIGSCRYASEKSSSLQGRLVDLIDEYKKLESGSLRNPVAVLIKIYHHYFHLSTPKQHYKRHGEYQAY